MLANLSDGEDLTQLAQRVDDVPIDLKRYFKCIVQSVKEPHRTEAALIFQLAAWTENKSLTWTPFRLVDIIFLDIPAQHMKLDCKHQTLAFRFQTQHSIDTLMDSLDRKLNSRTRGMLECLDKRRYAALHARSLANHLIWTHSWIMKRTMAILQLSLSIGSIESSVLRQNQYIAPSETSC